MLHHKRLLALAVALTGSLLSSAQATPKRPTLPFDAAMYAMFVMPYPDIRRGYETSTFLQVNRSLQLNLAVPTRSGFKPLGVWTTARALSDAYGPSPAALALYTRDVPGPPMASTDTAAVAVLVSKWQPSPTVYQAYVQKRTAEAAAGEYRRTLWNRYSVFTFCPEPSFDYPAVVEQVRSSCISRLATPKVFLQITGVNLGESETVKELRRVAEGIDVLKLNR